MREDEISLILAPDMLCTTSSFGFCDFISLRIEETSFNESVTLVIQELFVHIFHVM